MLRTIALLVAALAAQASPMPTPTPDTPVYVGNPAARFTVESRPLEIDPDGRVRWLVVAHFFDAQNNPTMILANSDFDWLADRGHVQWQSRMRYGSPAAAVTTDREGIINLTVRANKPRLGIVRVAADTRVWRGARTIAAPLGPHLVQIGWFPRANDPVRIVRIGQTGTRTQLAVLPAGSSTFRDTGVAPGKRYRYVVTRGTAQPTALAPVVTPAELPTTTVAAASGKAMWLFFSLNPIDDNYYGKLDPHKIVDRAVRSGLHYVALRTAYGAFWQITPQAKPTIDAIVDGLAAHGILTMGWTVPREATFEDLQAGVQTATYRTARGTPLAGLAIDVERGSDFMGGDPLGLDALWTYVKYVREAVGPKYLLVATVEDPYLEHLDNRTYPYREIARYSNVLQPMAYWRMMRRRPTDPATVKILLKASYDKLIAQSGRRLPVSFGGQTTAGGRNGPPPAQEITASLQAARALGAIGECFFDWDGTQPDQWDALAAYNW
jgi:hypothetical protein